MNIFYRIWQFRKSFQSPPSQEDWEKTRLFLSPVEAMLFTKLPVPDQNHSLRVLEALLKDGETNDDLLKTALLHDVGKSLHPLNRWERVFSVLLPAFAPRLAKKWGNGEPTGIKRPLVVISQHPKWGADMLQNAGCSEEVIWLVKNHEQVDPSEDGSPELHDLLLKLQEVDNLN